MIGCSQCGTRSAVGPAQQEGLGSPYARNLLALPGGPGVDGVCRVVFNWDRQGMPYLLYLLVRMLQMPCGDLRVCGEDVLLDYALPLLSSG